MIQSVANLAVIADTSVVNILSNPNIITPNIRINIAVVESILAIAPLINNPDPFLNGFSFMYSSFGGSPPKLREFRESMMILIIRICTAAKNGLPPEITGYNILIMSNDILIGSWNSRNIIILCINVLPSSIPFTTLAKLLSVRIMSPASFATSDPACIANPTSAFLSAGESFTPSPVIATDIPAFPSDIPTPTDIPVFCAIFIRRSFVFGEHLEITVSFGRISLTFSSVIASNSSLVTAKSPVL